MHDPIPSPCPIDMPLLVAVASRDGGTVDQHFGQIDELWIYTPEGEGGRLVARRKIDDYLGEDDDRREATIRALDGCVALLAVRIGDAPRARLGKLDIAAVDGYAGQPVESSIGDFFRARAAEMAR